MEETDRLAGEGAAPTDCTPALPALLRRIFLAFFERLYGPWSGLYEPVSWLVSRGAWPAWVRAASPFVEGPALEIGPGTGHLLLALGRRGTPAVGLDRSVPLLVRARARSAVSAAAQPAPLVVADAAALPFGPGAFRSAVTTFPAPFVIDPAVHAELRRILVPGGRWVILDGAVPGGKDPWSGLVRLLLAGPPAGRRRRTEAVPAPCRVAVPLAERLAKSGFRVTATELAVGRDRVGLLLARPAEAPTEDGPN